MQPKDSSFTTYGRFCLIWLLVSAFQYGFHISALNQISDVLTCRSRSPSTTTSSSPKYISYHIGLPSCIPMSDAQFSTVTALFTLGGLLGSLAGSALTSRRGRKGALSLAAILTSLGAFLTTLGPSIPILALGRVFVGLGAGIGICVGPVFLAELAPPSKRGSTGVFFQLAIVSGILATQGVGLLLASPWLWRGVPFVSAVLALVQLALAGVVCESHAWLEGHGKTAEAQRVREMLWKGGDATYESVSRDPEDLSSSSDDEFDALSPFPASTTTTTTAAEDTAYEGGPIFPSRHSAQTLSLPALLRAPELRTPLAIVAAAMAAQQLAGINAILYYSNTILGKTMPALGPYVSLAITVVNVAMTLPSIVLIERMGRKALFNVSMLGALISLICVGLGIDSNTTWLSSGAIIAFIASFACGLGPVPFVIISDIAPYHAVSALSSAALTLNWIANFLVGLAFLPLRNFLAWGDPRREGRVFYVFAAALVLFGGLLNVVYRDTAAAARRGK